jgi:hypothetical protein
MPNSGRTGPALELGQGTPDLEQDFLGEVLAILAVERVGTGHFQDGAAVLTQPPLKERFWGFVQHFKAFPPQKYW